MYKNSTNIPLSMAVWLATDSYDHNHDSRAISATSLLKPVKATVLERALFDASADVDIADLVQAKMGNAVHDSIEQAWKKNARLALLGLGVPERVVNKIIINPNELQPGDIPVYLEIRSSREIDNYLVQGKFDFVMEGQLQDFKTTGTYNYIHQGNAESYILQGSIYRWLNQDIITNDHMKITYLFTDWSAIKARTDKRYPQLRVMDQTFPLKSVAETERWIRGRLAAISASTGLSQSLMPVCSQEELWQSDSVWKYYKDPNKTSRSTKNFDNPGDAYQRQSNDGGAGMVLEVKGEVKRCRYCNVSAACAQAESLQAAGLLTL